MIDAVVVGGGIAGLVAARDLAKSGASVVLIEASSSLGGMIRRHTVAGLDLDMGAESFATRNDAVATLAVELGLGNDIVEPDSRGAWIVRRDGQAAPMPKTGLLGIPSAPMAEDVIRVIGGRAAARAQLDALLPGPVGARAESLGALVRRRMGAGVLDDLVVPVVTGVHSTHPDALDPDRVAPGLRAALQREGSLARAVLALRSRAAAGSAVQGIRGGIVRLADELIADLDTYHVDVRRSTSAVRIAADGVDVVSGADELGRPDHSETIRASHVLASVADPGRPVAARRTGIELITLVVDQPDLDAAPRGTGLLVHPEAAGIAAKALTHATVKWKWLADAAEGKHVVRLSYEIGPMDGSDAIGVGTSIAVDPDSEIGRRAISDASKLLGVPLGPERVLGAARVRWHGADTAPPGLEEGVIGIGEAESGRGLAAIVRAARASVDEILNG